MINHVFGGDMPWLTDMSYAMLAIVIETLWWTVGFSFLLYLAALQSIPGHLYEAAKLDGANAWHRMVHITPADAAQHHRARRRPADPRLAPGL